MMAFFQSFGPLFLMSLVGSVLSWICAMLGRDPSNTFIQVWTYAFYPGVFSWVETDARLYRRTPFFDFCFLISFAVPFSLFWYLFRTRGSWTLLLVPMLFVLWMLPAISLAIAWVSIHG